MVKTRTNNYGSEENKPEFKDEKAQDDVFMEKRLATSTTIQNIMSPPNPDQDIFLDHKMVPSKGEDEGLPKFHRGFFEENSNLNEGDIETLNKAS